MSPSGFHWRLELKHFDDLYVDEKGDIRQLHEFDAEQTNHSSGQSGNDYFGWEDAKNANARELAELIKRRFPRLLQSCRGANFQYVGWFVYMLGQAENEKLPVFFLEYNEPEKGFIFSTLSGERLLAPPHSDLNIKNETKWLWVQRIENGTDWHTAHRPVIDAIKNAKVPKFPKYPSHTTHLITHAAYWEGAVYYLQTVMHYNDEEGYISDRVYKNSRWEQFEAIYDSEGQLHLFDAYMASVALRNASHKIPQKLKVECEQSLKDINLIYRDNKYQLPNPYFGGNNPLHLTELSMAPVK